MLTAQHKAAVILWWMYLLSLSSVTVCCCIGHDTVIIGQTTKMSMSWHVNAMSLCELFLAQEELALLRFFGVNLCDLLIKGFHYM